MSVTLTDSVELAGTRRTRDGFLVAECRIARAGNVQTYTGRELGDESRATVRLYRPEDVVFDTKALSTWAFKTVTVTHPDEMVTADNWKEVTAGMTGGDVVRDGEFVRVPMILMDRAAIDEVEQGTRELSCGYAIALDWEPGTTPNGEAYDARVSSITGNHVALVARGRAGSDCRIGDGQPPRPAAKPTTPAPINSQKDRIMPGELRTVVVDGLSIETTTHGAQVIERLQRQLSDAATATDAARTDHQRVVDGLQGQLAALNTTHRQAIEARDGEIAGLRASHATELATRDGEIAALRVAASDAALDQRVAQRTALVAQVRRVLGDTFDPTGRTDADMRRAVVVHAMGDALTEAETRSDAFFAAAFEAVVATRAAAPTAPARDAALAADPLRVAVATGIVAADAANQQPSAWQRHVDRLSNAWKNPSKEAV